MPDEPAREIEVEVLPPGATTGARSASPGARPRPPGGSEPRVDVRAEPETPPQKFDDPFVALVSRLMDTAFVIPGTNIRFGLDPILGLIPGFGDGAAALTSVALFLQSARYGIPRIVLARMALNVVLNGTLGAIPVVGDAFSFWFKSNARNYELLCAHAAEPGKSTRQDWLFVGGLLVGMLILLALAVIGYVAVGVVLVKAITGR
jgi:hypothetical protein